MRRLNDVTEYEIVVILKWCCLYNIIVEKTVRPGKLGAQLAPVANHWFTQLHGDE